ELRNHGAHFTTERDILRTLRPLFLDALEQELANAKTATTGRLNRLREFRAKLPTLTFLDPACGCGNFLMVAFQNLRRLELEVQLAIRDAEGASATGVFNIDLLRQVTLNQFHGIELEEFPDRKSTRLNSSHVSISYAVFCLKKKTHLPVSRRKENTAVTH